MPSNNLLGAIAIAPIPLRRICGRIAAEFSPTIREIKAVMAILIIAITIPLSACGGGGGGSAAANMNPGVGPNPTRTPTVAVQAEGNPVEGSEVRIRATSDIPAPEGGLPVRVNVDGALPNDIDSSACTGVVCTVFIPAGRREAVIVITPRADSTTETSETWTIRLGDSDDYQESREQSLIIFVVRDAPSTLPTPGLTPNIRIEGFSGVIEGDEVRLTVTSDIPAGTGGLTVTLFVSGADAAEFTAADCSGLTCEVTIPEGMTIAELILSPLGSDSVENIENWQVRIGQCSSACNAGDNFRLAVSNLPFPLFLAGERQYALSELNAFITPIPLAQNQIRAGGDDDSTSIHRMAITITGFAYANADSATVAFVQSLEYAHLGIWINGVVTDNDFNYASLSDNIVMPPTPVNNRGSVFYDVEGDATWRGVNFYPDGLFHMNFNTGIWNGLLTASGHTTIGEPFIVLHHFANEFGDDNAMVPDGQGGLRQIMITDSFNISFDGDITSTGLKATRFSIFAGGFFADLHRITPRNFFSGKFHDASGYNPTSEAPAELSGSFLTNIGGGADELHLGFLGKRQ